MANLRGVAARAIIFRFIVFAGQLTEMLDGMQESAASARVLVVEGC